MFESSRFKVNMRILSLAIGVLSFKISFLNIERDLLSLKTVKFHDLKCQFQILEIGCLNLQIGF